MSQGQCKDCKYWEAPKPLTVRNMGQCSSSSVCGGEWWPGCSSDIAVASDPFCGLDTGPNFGCVHFEEKA